MLQTIINGQSSLRSDLMVQVGKLDIKIDDLRFELSEIKSEIESLDKKLSNRLDKLGLQIAELEDDALTRE